VEGVTVQLTPMEIKLLYYLIAHSGEVVSSQQLLEKVWGYPPGTGSGNLVRMHILNLRAKVEADPHRPKLLRTQPKHGYIYDPSADDLLPMPSDRPTRGATSLPTARKDPPSDSAR
jgi:DNA-binding response OmpR family regulator